MESAKVFKEFQIRVDSVTNENVGETFKWLENSQLLKEESDFKMIVSILLQYSYVRPRSLTTISFLAAAALKKLPQKEQLSILINNFRHASSPFGIIASANVIFMVNCIDFLKIPYELVIDSFHVIFTEQLFNRDDYFALYIFLGPTFEKYQPELFRSILKQYKESTPMWVSNFGQIRANEWEEMKNNRKENGVKGGLSYCIKKDDIASLRMASLSPSFKIDQIVKFTIYEPNVHIVSPPTVFDFALFCGSMQIVKYILSSYLPSHPEMTHNPAHARYAVAGGSMECVRILKENNFTFVGCLHIASLFHQREVFNWLLEQNHGKEITKDEEFGTVLLCAIQMANFDLAIQCIENGSDINAIDHYGYAPIHTAVESGFVPMINLILASNKVNINMQGPNGMTPLMIAVESNYQQIVKLLLLIPDIQINIVDNVGLSALGHAACNGSIEIIKLLLTRDDIDVNLKDEEDMTPLYSAFEAEEYEACRVLVEDPRTDIATPNQNGVTILHLSASGVDFELFKAVISRAEINTPDLEGTFAVHYAAGNGSEYLKAMIEAGASPTVRDSSSRTPLHFAVRSGSVDSVLLLISIPEVDVNAGDSSGLTPLHYAANLCNVKVLRALLQSDKLNPNAVSTLGAATPIQVSVSKQDEESIKAFLEKDGIDVQTAIYRVNSMKGGKSKSIKTLLTQYQRKQNRDMKKQ